MWAMSFIRFTKQLVINKLIIMVVINKPMIIIIQMVMILLKLRMREFYKFIILNYLTHKVQKSTHVINPSEFVSNTLFIPSISPGPAVNGASIMLQTSAKILQTASELKVEFGSLTFPPYYQKSFFPIYFASSGEQIPYDILVPSLFIFMLFKIMKTCIS